VLALIPPPFNTAFPSGHTAATTAIALAFYVADRRIGAAAFVIAGLTAFGRMATGVHYPTDLLGGAATALLAFAIVRHMHAGIRARDIRRSVAHHHHA
jgi:undecaprenyl-diphosphatase